MRNLAYGCVMGLQNVEEALLRRPAGYDTTTIAIEATAFANFWVIQDCMI
jgi:hypothetical protein